MKKFFILLISLIVFNFSFCNEIDMKIDKLKEEKQLKIEKEIAYIQRNKWLLMSREEKIQILMTLNKQSRGKEEIIKDIEMEEELVKIGVFGIEIKEESG